MTWARYRISEIPPEELVIEQKRFPGEKLLLTELIDVNLYMVRKYFESCRTPLDVINRVIVDIRYPLDWLGRPTDYHYYQAYKRLPFKCIVALTNRYDFWNRCSETILLKWGDCEDTSHLTAGGLQLLGARWFVCYGRVYYRERLLGGHAYVIFEHDGKWRLVETTLDEPYRSHDDMPVVNLDVNVWRWREIKYETLIMWNLEEIWLWSEAGTQRAGEALRAYMREREAMKKKRKLEKEKLKMLSIGLGRKVKGT